MRGAYNSNNNVRNAPGVTGRLFIIVRGIGMSYYFSKIVNTGFDQAVANVTANLKEAGFGVLTEIDVKATMKKKLDKDLRPYLILGSCNPEFAYQAIQAEDKIGTMLPCNVIVRECEDGQIEVAAVDPAASMQAVNNPALVVIASEVRDRLKDVIAKL